MGSKPELGLVVKGFCDGLKKIMREYVLLVNQLEEHKNNPKVQSTVDRIKNYIKSLDINSSSVNITEINLEDKYRIIIEIDKDAL